MTSSPISRFKFAKRRVLFLSAQKAAIYHWYNGQPGNAYLFDVTDEGRRNFERYLRETPNTTMYILVDIFDEEFRRDVIPHVFGRDRASIMERKKTRLFRDTPFQYTRVQGREEDGRRDDRILLTAITNPGLVEPWLALLDQHKVPLAGLHSLPLFTESLLGEIPNASNYMLIVSLQSVSGLRQTFFQNREFRISRLVQMPRYGSVPYAPYIEEEVNKIHRYLSSLRLISLEEPLDIYFFLTGGLLDELKEYYEDTNFIRYHFLDINEMAAKAGVPLQLNAPFSDQYFAYQFLKRRQQNCYATPTNLRYFALRRMRFSMLAASVALMLSGLIWGGMNLTGGLTLKQRSNTAANMTNFYQTRYNIARSRLPKTPVEAADLKVAVELAGTLSKYKTSPREMMQALSRGLNQFPQIKLDDFTWSATMNPDVNPGETAPGVTGGPGMTGDSSAVVDEKKFRYYQIAVVNAHLEPFDGDFRKAIDTINSFVEAMKSGSAVHSVKLISLPLDISSSANLTGGTSAVEEEANFSIGLVVGVGDAS